MLVNYYLKRVLPPASPKMTGVCGGTWKYPFPFWTRFSCSPFTVGTRTQSDCKTNRMTVSDACHSLTTAGHGVKVEKWIHKMKLPEHHCRGLVDSDLAENHILTVVHLVLFLVHGVDASSGPELQQSLEQQSTQVHCKDDRAITVSKLAVMRYTVSFSSALFNNFFLYKMGLSQMSHTLGRIHQSLKSQRPSQTPRRRSSRSHPTWWWASVGKEKLN